MAAEKKTAARTIDQYLANLPADQRAALGKLRKAIRAAAPAAEECISYGLAAFRHDGMLVGFGGTAKHCAFYLMSTATIATHAHELADYDTSAGTIRFAASNPLPTRLVRKLVAARLAENGAKVAGAARRAPKGKARRRTRRHGGSAKGPSRS